MIAYNAGDKVWWARCNTVQTTKKCPICFGNRCVLLVLGDGTEEYIECEYCGKGYEGPRGYIQLSRWVASAVYIEITSVEIKQTTEGEEREYLYAEYERRTWHIPPEDIFNTEAEARERCKDKSLQHDAEEDQRKQPHEYAKRDYAWRVGYHRKQIKNAERTIARNTKKLSPELIEKAKRYRRDKRAEKKAGSK